MTDFPPTRSLLAAKKPARAAVRRRGDAAFTLIEVVLASFVMILGISTSIIVLQRGMQAIDTARYTTLAGQILQSQMEKLRLLTWAQLVSATGPTAYPTFGTDISSSSAQLDSFKAARGGSLTQSIADAPAPFTNMKDITLTATWTGSDGRTHSLKYMTRYGRNGISDFFYTSH